MTESTSPYFPIEVAAACYALHLNRHPNPQRFATGRIGLIFVVLRRVSLLMQTNGKLPSWAKMAMKVLQRFAELGSINFLLQAMSRYNPDVLRIPEDWTGKDPINGRMRFPQRLFWYPFSLVEHVMFRYIVKKILSSPKPFLDKYNLVDSTNGRNLYVGMWPGFINNDLPPDVGLIFDLANEYEESADILKGRDYIGCPMWDQTTPQNVERFIWCVDKAAAFQGNVLVHCGFGVGRSVQAAVAIMIRRGLASNWQEAAKKIKANRPYAEVRPHAAAFLEDITPRLLDDN